MARTSAAVKNRWNGKNYDRIAVLIPKGRMADLKAYCSENSISLNGLVNELLRDRIGFTPERWKRKTTAGSDTHPEGK